MAYEPIVGSNLNKGSEQETFVKWEYDTHYFENMIEMYAATGQKINRTRWDFILNTKSKLILDYGCGCNMFGLFRPDKTIVDSYDIGHIGEASYPQTGIRHEKYDLICFWDVLEHVDWESEPDEDILNWMQKTTYVAATLPIHPTNKPGPGWKHWKPDEHLTYFTIESFAAFMEEQGFELTMRGMPECPPRKDIVSFLLRRVKWKRTGSR